MKNILMIVGSLRKNSFNRQLAGEIQSLIGPRARVEFLEYSSLPYMNQDLEFPPPAEVERVRAAVLAADGIWICSPEHNHNIPGALKNLLDWLSRPIGHRKGTSALRDKPMTFSCCAGKSAAIYVRSALKDLAQTVSASLVYDDGVGVSLDGAAFASDVLSLSDGLRLSLADQAEAFLAALPDKGI